MNIFDTREYDSLPESVKANYSFLQWLWLSETEKAHLVERECQQETFED